MAVWVNNVMYFMPAHDREAEAQHLVDIGILRPVNTRRKRLLRKRGEYVQWSKVLHRWVWYPNCEWYTSRPRLWQRLHPEAKEQVLAGIELAQIQDEPS